MLILFIQEMLTKTLILNMVEEQKLVEVVEHYCETSSGTSVAGAQTNAR